MNVRKRIVSGVLALSAVAVGGLALPLLAQTGPAQNRPPKSAPVPGGVSDLASGLKQTAAVIEGIVTSVEHTYSEDEGPWTVTTLSEVQAHFGRAPKTVQLRQFGGPLPDETRLVVHDQPEFEKGARYLVFLRNTSWNYSPIVSHWVARIEDTDGRQRLVDPGGHLVRGIDDYGLTLGPVVSKDKDMETHAVAAAEDLRDEAGRAVGAEAPVEEAKEGASLQDFLGQLNRELKGRGLELQGAFYDAPGSNVAWRGPPTETRKEDAQDTASKADGLEPGTSQPDTSLRDQRRLEKQP